MRDSDSGRASCLPCVWLMASNGGAGIYFTVCLTIIHILLHCRYLAAKAGSCGFPPALDSDFAVMFLKSRPFIGVCSRRQDVAMPRRVPRGSIGSVVEPAFDARKTLYRYFLVNLVTFPTPIGDWLRCRMIDPRAGLSAQGAQGVQARRDG